MNFIYVYHSFYSEETYPYTKMVCPATYARIARYAESKFGGVGVKTCWAAADDGRNAHECYK